MTATLNTTFSHLYNRKCTLLTPLLSVIRVPHADICVQVGFIPPENPLTSLPEPDGKVS